MTRVAIDVVPVIARPDVVASRLSEASEMRERTRQSAEAVAAAQHAVDEREREDVEAAAARARAGEPLGAPSRALTKARDELMIAQRNQNALRLALEQTQDVVGEAITEHADAWVSELADEAERAREQGRAAVVALREACARVGDAVSAQNWIVGAISDQRFDRPLRAMIVGSTAPSSRSRTVNNEPLTRDELLGYVDELLLEPTTAAAPAPITLATTSA